MEQSEVPVKREYDNLNDSEKVTAILAVVMEPVSKPFAIELSGVDYSHLDEKAKKEVDELFTSEGMEVAKVGEDIRYRLGDKARESLSTGIDMKSVHGKIADKLWGDLGLEF